MRGNSRPDLVQNIGDLPVAFNAAVDLIDHNLAAGRSAKTAYIDAAGSYSYGELASRVSRFGSVLAALGVEREQRVLMCVQDSIDFPTIFLGSIRAGVVPIPVNTLFTTEEYKYLLNDSRARVLFVSKPCFDRFEPILGQCPFLSAVVICGDDPDRPVLHKLMEKAAETEPAVTRRDEPAFWLYTSGSTGHPKGAIHIHSSLRLTADLYARGVLGIEEEDVVYSVAKLFFAYGLGNGLTFPLSVGATTILYPERPTPESVSRIIRDHDISVFCGVPTFFAGFLASPDTPTREEARRLRCATSAGEALPAPLAEAFSARFGVEILDGLGSTEMLHIFVSQVPGAPRYGVTGKPVPGYEIRIVRDDGSDAAVGEVGELYVQGPTAAVAYWNNHPKSRDTFLGPWTRTSDKYTRDAEGFLRYAGRSDDMLKVSGIYVSPFDVEETLAAHPAVLEAAVVGIEDDNGMIKPKAFVVCRHGHDACEQLISELKRHVKENLPPHCYPRWIEFVSNLPKTATGKLQRFKLRSTSVTTDAAPSAETTGQ